MPLNNQFQYQRHQYLTDVTMLPAKINDFSYGRHAHEELSIGVTRQGLQHFNSGAFHRSEPGNIVQSLTGSDSIL